MPGLLCLALAALTALLPGTANAAEPVRTLRGYTVTSWSGSEGLTLGPVRALAQDASGYIWLGTDSGLVRFDGFHFAAADAVSAGQLPRLTVRSLLVAADGDLWVGLGEGGGIYRLRDGHVVGGGAHRAVPGAVNTLAQDHTGTIWAGHDNGLLQLRDGEWAPVAVDGGFPGARVLHLHEHGETLYIGTSSGMFTRDSTGRVSHVASADDAVRGSAEDAHGAIWITDPLRGFRPVTGDDARPHRLAGRGSELLRDSSGQLWLATIGQGLWRINTIDASIERLTVQNGLLTDGIWSLLEDREGNLWVGTHEGLNRLTRHTMTPLGDLGITSTIVRGPGNVMWAASTDGVIAFGPAAGAEPRRTVFPLTGVRTLHVDARGTVWAGAAGGLHHLQNGQFIPVALPGGLPLRRITAITSDRHQAVWFADATQGLWRWDGIRLMPHEMPEQLRAQRITALHADQAGSIWVALEGGALVQLHGDGAFTTYGERDGLLHRNITGIYESGETGLWITGSQGVSHFADGHFTTFGRDQGLPSRSISGMAEDVEGGVWLSMGDIGLARVPLDEVFRAMRTPGYRARLRVFDTSDGMAGMPTSLDSKTAARADDGRLWFVTGRGLTVVDPRVAAGSRHASGPVRVEAAVADDRRFEAGTDVRLPAGTNRVRIDYTALNLTAAERTRFRYRLDGFDDDWRPAGTRRQAFYTNLPPREYRFQVQTQATDGTWTTAPATWSFSIAPRFYQTRTAAALAVVTVLLLIAGAWQLRLRQVRHEFALVLAERTRLSREVHDTLLQSMVGVALQIDSVAKTRSDSTGELVTIRREIEDCIVDARQAIWNMRSGTSGHGDLIAALEGAGARATTGTAVRFRLAVSGTPRRCPGHVETELLRIGQEALANAVHHARPANISMDLRYDEHSVTLRVTDDGTGFDQSARASTDHFGLITMQERAEQLGGRFHLESASGTGTVVETIIPVASSA